MDNNRKIKDLLYEQVARIGKALSSPKRLELIELLSQGEKAVDRIAREAEISVKLASAHLRELKLAHLVETRREGKHVFYRLADERVADFWGVLHGLAENRLVELRAVLSEISLAPEKLVPSKREALMKAARNGEVIVLDVRPLEEYNAGHLPFARSIPLGELRQRVDELAPDRPVVAYCRGPFCLMARDAVMWLRGQGYHAAQLTDGVVEWRLGQAQDQRAVD